MQELFRRHAVAHHFTSRIAGDVVLAAPLSISIMSGLLVFVVALTTCFVATNSYARKETVSGWLVPEGGLIRVTARSGGVVEATHVKEGDAVLAGAPIATLRLSTDAGSGDSGQVMAKALSAEAQANETLARAAQAKLRGQRMEMVGRKSILTQELAEADKRIKVSEQRQGLLESIVARRELLLARGYDTKNSLDEFRADVLSAAQDVSSARGAALALHRQIVAIDNEIRLTSSDSSVLESQAAQATATLGQRIAVAQAQSTFIATAPIDGRVAALPIELGQAVSPGAAVAVMTPDKPDLIAELYIPSRASGFIKSGQEVQIKYQAFPYQTFGAAKGIVKSVSRTVLAPGEVAIPGLTFHEPVFRVRVALARQSIMAYERAARPQPGMLLTADVIVDRRSLLQWLLDPLYAVGRRA